MSRPAGSGCGRAAGCCSARSAPRRRRPARWGRASSSSRTSAIPIRRCRSSIRASRAIASSAPASSSSRAAFAGPKGRCGSATAATCCSATSPTTASFAGTRPPAPPSVFRQPSNFSNGLVRDRQGRLRRLRAPHAPHHAHRVRRRASPCSPTAIDGKRFNSPNDIVCRARRLDLVHRPAVRHRRPLGGREGRRRSCRTRCTASIRPASCRR